MKKIKQILLLLVAMPLTILAQPSEYVKDNKVKTVGEAPVLIQQPLQQSVQATPIFEKKSVETLAENPIVVNSKSIETVEVEEESLPNMRFEKKRIHFGRLKMGAKPTYIYYFTNISKEPIIIDLVTACDCTEIEYSKAPILAGEKGFIKATFHTELASEYLNKEVEKDITIILKNKYPENGYPMVESLYFKAFLEE